MKCFQEHVSRSIRYPLLLPGDVRDPGDEQREDGEEGEGFELEADETCRAPYFVSAQMHRARMHPRHTPVLTVDPPRPNMSHHGCG